MYIYICFYVIHHAVGALYIFFYYALYQRHAMITIQLSHKYYTKLTLIRLCHAKYE